MRRCDWGWFGRPQGSNFEGGTLTKNSTSFTVYGTSNTFSYIATTKNTIDLNNYNKYCCEGYVTNPNDGYLVILGLNVDGIEVNKAIKIGFMKATSSVTSVDIVDKNPRYAQVFAYGGVRITIYKIWLEK